MAVTLGLVSSAVVVVVATLLWLGAVWKTAQLAISPGDPGRRMVAVTLLCLAITVSFRGPVLSLVSPFIDPLLGPLGAVLIRNLTLVGAGYSVLGLLLYAGGESRLAFRLAVQRLPAAACATLMVAGWYSALPIERAQAEYEPSAAGMVLFWTSGVLYSGIASAFIAVLTARRAAQAERRTAIALRVAAVGWWGIVVFLAIPRLPEALFGARGYVEPAFVSAATNILLPLSDGLIIVGLSLPVIWTRWASLRLWICHRRLCKALEPLWLELHRAFPQHTLTHVGGSTGRPLLHVHQRFYRRLVECRDGLILLSPYIVPVDSFDPAAQARAVEQALENCQDNRPPTAAGPVLAEPQGTSVEDDARALAALAGHLTAR